MRADGSLGGGSVDRFQVAHQVAEHRALAAAGRDHPLGGLLVEALDAGAGLDRGRVDVPVDGDRVDVVDRIDQALVAQVAEHQQLGRRAQGHQRDQLALVDEHGERPLGGNRDLPLAPNSSRTATSCVSGALAAVSRTRWTASCDCTQRRRRLRQPARRWPGRYFFGADLRRAARWCSAATSPFPAANARRRPRAAWRPPGCVAHIGAGIGARPGVATGAGAAPSRRPPCRSCGSRRPRGPATGRAGRRRPCRPRRPWQRSRRPWPWPRRTARGSFASDRQGERSGQQGRAVDRTHGFPRMKVGFRPPAARRCAAAARRRALRRDLAGDDVVVPERVVLFAPSLRRRSRSSSPGTRRSCRSCRCRRGR